MACCGKKRKVIEVVKKPDQAVSTKTRYLSWYDPMPDRGNIWQFWTQVRRTSNTLFIYLPDLGDLLHKLQVEQWPNVILGGSGEEIDRTADAAKAIFDAGFQGDLIVFYADEPDLAGVKVKGRNFTENLNHMYDALAGALAARGIRDRCKLTFVWSLAGTPPYTWRRRMEEFGIPKMDVIATDGWYTGSSNELHLVKHRAIQFFEYLFEKGDHFKEMDILHVIKVFSDPDMDHEPLNARWVKMQMDLVTGLGTSKYMWTNPNFGDTSEITLEPLEPKYQGENLMFFLMDSTPRGDVELAGGNCPEVINAIAEYAKPRGWTME